MMRVQNFNIGEAVYQALANNEAVAAYVGSRIFPLVAPEGTEFPYIVYSRLSVATARDKDSFFYQQDVMETVVICTETYKEGVDISMAVGAAMQFGEREFNTSAGTIRVMESTYDSGTEDYVNNTFVQGAVYHLKVR